MALSAIEPELMYKNTFGQFGYEGLVIHNVIFIGVMSCFGTACTVNILTVKLVIILVWSLLGLTW